MADRSKIECTDATWNPVTGCTHLSKGCDNCYAERFSNRFRNVAGHPFESGFALTLRPARIDQPVRWKRPRLIFVNSMSDLFHKKIPRDYIDRVFETMEQANWHNYQILTKRSSLMRNYINHRYPRGSAPRHIWLGVSIEDASVSVRRTHLRQTRAETRFVCFEPLLGPVHVDAAFDVTGLDWVIASGESGPGARPVDPDWVRQIRDACVDAHVPFFFKQWGGLRPKTAGNTLDGRTWEEFPAQLSESA